MNTKHPLDINVPVKHTSSRSWH